MDVHRGDEIGRDEREIAEAQPAETRVGAVMNVVRCPSVEENDMPSMQRVFESEFAVRSRIFSLPVAQLPVARARE